MIYIYALIDPFTKQIRYIGKSIRPKERLTNHCNDKSITWRTNWIQSVLAKGKRPELLILQTLDDSEDWQLAESEWIKKAREMNWPLTNCTDGGDGLVNPPEEVRQKIITTWIGRKHSDETKKLIGQASKGRKHTEEYKEYMRQIMTGRKITWKDKLSKPQSKRRKQVLCSVCGKLQRAKGLCRLHYQQEYRKTQGGIDMRILTPSEQREVERIKGKMTTGEISIDLYTEQDNLVITTLDKELWLNILDLALRQNETIKKDWIKNYG